MKFKRLTSILLALCMILIGTSVYANPFTPEYLPETKIDTSIVSDGMFYFASTGLDVTENAGHGYLLKIARFGDNTETSKIRVTMLGQTASFNKDYSVRLYDSGFFGSDIHNASGSKSMLDIITENEDDISEYNFSDAVIDGMVDPDEELVSLTEEDKEQLQEQATELAETVLNDEAEQIAENAPEAVKEEIAAEIHNDGKMSLSEAKANATGLQDDKLPMTGGTAAINSPYMTNQQAELNNALNSAYMIIDFKDGETEKYIEITPLDNDISDGSRRAFLQLSAEENALVSEPYSGFTLNIIDDEEYVPAKVSLSASEYHAENGYVTVYVEREGDLSNVFDLYIDTEDITAQNGVNYSELHSKLQFPFGIKKRHVNIPIRTLGLTEEARFKIRLSDPSGCELGEITEAEGVISPDDISFKARTQSEGSDETVELMAAYGLNSVELGKEMDLKNAGYSQTIASGSSGWVNDHWELETTGSLYDSYINSQCFRYDYDAHYDFSGWQFDWEMESSKPCYAYTWLYNSWGGKSDYDGWKEFDADRWGRQTNRYYFNAKNTGYLSLKLKRSGSFLCRSPKIKIYSIKPILRPIEIQFKSAEPVSIRNANGDIVPCTSVDEYKNKCDTLLENASNTGTGTLITHSGENVTVSLKNTDKFQLARISGIRIVSPDGKRSTEISGVKTNGTSASFTITNDFLRNYDNYITYPSNGSNGLKANFTVQPILSNIKATFRVMGDTRAVLHERDNFYSYKSLGNNNIEFNCHVGDFISLKEELTETYTNEFIWSGFKNDADGITYNRKDGEEYITRSVTNASRTIYPVYAERNNMRLVVRVKTRDIPNFEKYGIFKYSSEVNGNYTDYIIADSDKDTFDINKYYTLSARAVKSSMMPVWRPTYSTTRYSQLDFPFQTRELKSENVVYLECKNKLSTPYTISAKTLSEDSLNSRNAEATAWYPAKNTYLVIDSTHYGISDDNGNLKTMPFDAVSSSSVRIAVRNGGADIYKDIQLPSDTYDVSAGNIVLKATTYGSPYIESVTTYDANEVFSSKILIADEVSYWDAVINYRGFDPTSGVPYVDSAGATRYEKVESLEFIVINPTTHEEKLIVEAKQDKNDPTRWTASQPLTKGRREQYTDSDVLYARITTNRVIGDGTADEPIIDDEGNITGHNIITPEGLQHTTYPPLNSGRYFVENNPQENPEYQLTPQMDGQDFKLPILGKLLTNINIKSFNLSIEEIPGGLRLGFGAVLKKWGSIYDGSGRETSDTGLIYDLSNFKEGFSDMENMVKTMGSENKIGKMALGLPCWSITPFAGIYLDFKLCQYTDPEDDSPENYPGRVKDVYMFAGAGVYIGISGSFRYTYYMIIGGVPVYAGGDVSLSMLVEFGAEGNNNIDYKDLKNGKTPLDDVSWDFTFRTTFSTNAYVGLGLCGTLGVRGGFNFSMYFIVSPNIKRSYPDFHTTGFRATGAIKFWIDALFFSIPVPTPLSGTLYEAGYFEDLSKLDEKEIDFNPRLQGESTEPSLKPRGVPSRWVANEPSLMSAYGNLSRREIVKDIYDNPEQQILDIGNGRILMVYLDDDPERNDANRTALMYSVYDGESWSNPQIIQDDGTADFDPNLCDTGTKVLVSWVSRASTDEMESAVDYARSTEVYTVEFDKETGVFGEIERLTYDRMYDYDPKAIHDPVSGDTLLFYYKAEAAGDDFTSAVLPTMNNSEIVYMLYDGETGEWVRTKYFDNELADGADEAALVEQFGGQRFLPTPIEDFSVDNPVIVDFDAKSGYLLDALATSRNQLQAANLSAANVESMNEAELTSLTAQFNQILGENEAPAAIYAYSVDKDNNLDTSGDRELFIQAYRFSDHKTGLPIRITNNNVIDAAPQLIWDHNSNLYLFWIEGGDTVRYLNLSDSLKENALQDALYGNAPEWTPGTVSFSDSSEEKTAIGSFKAFVDNGVILIAFPQSNEEGNGTDIYVTGYAPEDNSGDGNMGSWSKPQILTEGGEINELPVMTALPDDTIMMINNRYKTNLAQEEYNVSDTRLVETVYEIIPSLEASSPRTNIVPRNTGDEFTVSVDITNTGVMTANSFKYNGRLLYGNDVVADIEEKVIDTPIHPGNSYEINETFTLPEGTEDDLSRFILELSVREGDIEEPVENSSPLFLNKPQYRIHDVTWKQLCDAYILTGRVENTGTAPSRETDKIKIEYNDLYGDYDGEYLFSNAEIPNQIGVGEDTSFITSFIVPKERIDKGFVNCIMAVYSEDGERLSDFADTTLTLEFPYEVFLTDSAGNKKEGLVDTIIHKFHNEPEPSTVEDFAAALLMMGYALNVEEVSYYEELLGALTELYNPDKSIGDSTPPENCVIRMNPGDTIQLSAGYEGGEIYNGGLMLMSVDDPAVAVVDENNALTAVGNGVSTLTACAAPYGGTDIYYVIVGDGEKQDNPKRHSSGGGSYASNTTDNTNVNSATPSADDGLIFKDVPKDAWFYEHIMNAYEKGLVKGTSADMYEPDLAITRGMFATVVYRLEGEPAVTSQNTFEDVAQGSYYENAITWARDNGIVMGYDDTHYAPEQTITREQMAAIIYRYAKFKGNPGMTGLWAFNPEFTDTKEISEYAFEAVCWNITNGILTGFGDGTIRPKEDATRAQMAVILNRINEKFTTEAETESE